MSGKVGSDEVDERRGAVQRDDISAVGQDCSAQVGGDGFQLAVQRVTDGRSSPEVKAPPQALRSPGGVVDPGR